MLPRLDLPQFEITLPITKKKVKYRPFVVKEEKIMLLALQNEDQEQIITAINQIISNCTFEQCNIDELPQIDVEYLFLNIRNKSLGEGVDVIATCTSCDKSNRLTLDLSKSTILEKEKVSPEIKLTDDTWIVVRYPSVRETYRLVSDEDDETIMRILASSIVTIIKGDQTYSTADSSIEEVVDFVGGLTKDQLKKINNFYESAPSIIYEDKFNCMHCREENVIKLDGLQNFFG